MIAVVHAFSRANSGDSLLVDLTLERLARAGAPPKACTVVAMEPWTFRDLPSVVDAGGEASGRLTRRALKGAWFLAHASLSRWSGGRLPAHPVEAVIREADAVVAVGGAYLRAGTTVNSVGVALNHLPTLLSAGEGPAPSLYLPQSIGPLRGPVGAVVRRGLARVGRVYVRDDRSLDELGALPNVARMPDLAVLAAAEVDLPEAAPLAGPVVMVGRAVDGPEGPAAAQRLGALARRVGARWAVQSEAGGDRSDARFYDRLGLPPAPLLRDVLRSEPPGVVISVRLHGALEAHLAGWPAIHLSYQRKGWAAYADLGLSAYVRSAYQVPEDDVVGMVRQLLEDPAPYWAAFASTQPGLRAASTRLDQELRQLVHPHAA